MKATKVSSLFATVLFLFFSINVASAQIGGAGGDALPEQVITNEIGAANKVTTVKVSALYVEETKSKEKTAVINRKRLKQPSLTKRD